MVVASGPNHQEAWDAASFMGTVASAGFMQSTEPQIDCWGSTEY